MKLATYAECRERGLLTVWIASGDACQLFVMIYGRAHKPSSILPVVPASSLGNEFNRQYFNCPGVIAVSTEHRIPQMPSKCEIRN